MGKISELKLGYAITAWRVAGIGIHLMGRRKHPLPPNDAAGHDKTPP